jgi:hypothetical protein
MSCTGPALTRCEPGLVTQSSGMVTTMKSRFIKGLLFAAAELSAELLDIPAQVTPGGTQGWRDYALLSPPRERSRTNSDCASCVSGGDELGRDWHRPDRLIWRVRRDLLTRLTRFANIAGMTRLARSLPQMVVGQRQAPRPTDPHGKSDGAPRACRNIRPPLCHLLRRRGPGQPPVIARSNEQRDSGLPRRMARDVFARRRLAREISRACGGGAWPCDLRRAAGTNGPARTDTVT